MENILDAYEKICSSMPNVYKVENKGNYLEVKTEFYFRWADEYLILYIIPEENNICLSDSNDVYRICDMGYGVDEKMLADFAEKLELEFNNYRFAKFVTLENVVQEINKFEKLKDLIEQACKDDFEEDDK